MEELPERNTGVSSPEQRLVVKLGVLYLVVWTAFFFISSAYTLHLALTQAEEYARIQAGAVCEQDVAFHMWNAKMGGVYVPVSAGVAPNPYPVVPARTVETPAGTLTKIHPPLMNRLVHASGTMRQGVASGVIGLQTLYANTTIDSWERRKLQLITMDATITEVSERMVVSGNEYMRLLRPLVMGESCKSCHANGYAEGAVHGGVSVSVPMAPFVSLGMQSVFSTLAIRLSLWLLGSLGIIGSMLLLKRRIGERDKAEIQLRVLTRDLEDRVADRTKTMEEREHQLRVAKETAESANQAKNDFMANISHEIRTPLNGILGMTDLLSQSELNEDQAAMTATIASSGASLLAVLNEVLDFSKIEAGKMRLDPMPFSLRDVAFDTVRSLAPIAHKKNLEFLVQIDERIPDYLLGDSNRLRQILMNLLSNALKFTPHGEVALWVQCADLMSHEVRMRVAVSDTGIGIPLEKQDLVFNAFEQVDASTTRRFSGTGLGLPIVRRLLELMDASLALESTPGKGSLFSFEITLPVLLMANVGNMNTSIDQVRGKRVLIVDDNATNRQIYLEQLRAWHMNAHECAGVDEALRSLELSVAMQKPFDLVLSDFQMPDKGGLDLINAMRETTVLRDIPVIVLSSSIIPPTFERKAPYCLDLMKPVRPEDLLAAIRKALGMFGESAAVTADGRDFWKDHPSSEVTLDILLVEDTETNQFVATKMLKNLGHGVTVAGDGRQAVNALIRRRYDLVLMDIQMPIMDGVEATRQIRQHEQNGILPGYTPIVAMTAHAMQEHKTSYLQAGMDGYVVKPLYTHTVLDALDAVTVAFSLGRKRRAEADIPAGNPLPAENGIPAADQTPAETETPGKAGNDCPGTDEPAGKNRRPARECPGCAKNAFLDIVIVADCIGENAQDIAESMRIFMRNAPKLIEQAKTAVAESDAETLAKTAHALKGITRYYTAGALYESIFALELMAGKDVFADNLPSIKDAITSIEEDLAALAHEMNEYIAHAAAQPGAKENT